MATILVVEDEGQVRVLAEAALVEQGHQTLTAESVEEALALLKSEEPIDLLFTDISLGDQFDGGLQLAQQASELRLDLPVLYTTGRGVTDGMRASFVKRFAFVAKPYTPADLASALGNLLKAKPAAIRPSFGR